MKPGVPKVVRFKLNNPSEPWQGKPPRLLLEQIVEKTIPGVVQIHVNMSLPFRREGEDSGR
ncbi:MAG: hypothetical protein HC848_04715 [Limnobacter sp.]|nr:hypothetical protein [Limnobacter sp.]